MNAFLKKIIQSKQAEVNLLKQQLLTVPNYITKKLVSGAGIVNADFLARELEYPVLTVIAEIKRYSP